MRREGDCVYDQVAAFATRREGQHPPPAALWVSADLHRQSRSTCHALPQKPPALAGGSSPTRHPTRMSWLSSCGSNAMVGSSPSVVVSRGAGPRYQLAVEAAKQAVELSQPLDML